MWQRLSPWFRAVVVGLIVAGAPNLVWGVMAGVNLRLSPAIPWSVAAMGLILWWFWRFMTGAGAQPMRRLVPREEIRANPLASRTWRLALLAGGSGVAAVWAAFAALRGVLRIAAPSGDLGRVPIAIIALMVLMGSAVAGVAEEAGFRGSMQRPLERLYGPAVAITVSSVIFTLVHLTHGLRILPFLPFYLAVAVVYGLMARLTDSIFPSMTLHFAGDVMMFTMQFLAVRLGAAGGGETGRIAESPALVAVVLIAVSVFAFRALGRSGRPAPQDSAVAVVGG
ncbi:MAG TPA: CPBP family intramembrane glutamic endopeptidase [Thermoanaerobaculia bacterium]|nr:CPBP family intramembrane glutamic endopeptidase [Thermoanaerobaculia bacterium]